MHKDCSWGLSSSCPTQHLRGRETEGGEEGQVTSNISIMHTDLPLCSVLGNGGRKEGGGACTAAAQVHGNTHAHIHEHVHNHMPLALINK